jgi:hypothetical protein
MIVPKFILTTDHRPLTTSLLLALLLLPGAALSQETPKGKEGSTPAKTQKFTDLTTRYRFIERYTSQDDKAGPGIVGSYRVAILDVIRDSVESSQGAPKRTELSRHTIYGERPVELTHSVGNVFASVKTIQKYQAKAEDASKTMGARPLEGATVLVRPRFGDLPLILSMTEGRTLTEYEYDVLAHQMFVPQLPALLPVQAVRLGDTWRVPQKGAQALLGDPSLRGDTLIGKLTEVRKEVDGPRMVASIAITGKAAGTTGETAVNAEVLFTFQGSIPPKDPAKKSTFPPIPTEGTMESRGAITEIRLASVSSGLLPGTGRLRFQSNRELTMHRLLGPIDGPGALPPFEKTPEASEDNTWLSHVDPSGHYALRHSQDLLPPDRSQAIAEPNTVLLGRTRREGRDMLRIEFVGKTLTPEDLKKKLAEKYALMKMEVLKGEETWLPEAEWPKMRVHRIDASLRVRDPKALVAGGGSTRIHFDGYLIQFGQSASILAITSTSRDDVAPFRQEVEQILKSIQLDPPRPASG